MLRILIIEDEVVIRRVFVKILIEESNMYEVVEVEDGLVGIEFIKKEDFDLIFCDIKMFKMDGVEVLEVVKKIKLEILIVMILGYGDLDIVVNIMCLGVFDYILKLFDLNRLLNIVCIVLDWKELVVENIRFKKKVS